MTDVTRFIGQRVRAEREKKKLTRYQLSVLMGGSDHQRTIARIERAEGQPSISTLFEIAQALGIDPGELLPDDNSGLRGRDSNPQPSGRRPPVRIASTSRSHQSIEPAGVAV